MRRGLAAVASAVVSGAAQALFLSLAALAVNGVEGGARLRFAATWGAIFFPPLLALALVELPLLTALFEARGRRDLRPAAAAAVGGALAGLLLGGLIPLVRSLGGAGPVALAAGGFAGALVLPPPGAWRPRRAAAGLALFAAIAGAALVLDPARRARARYAEDRPGEAALAAAAPVADGADPAALSDLELARAIARTYMRTHPPERLGWSWEEAVAVEGLLAFGARAGDPAPIGYARAWIDARAAEALSTPLYADSAAPASAVLALASRRPAPADTRIIARIDDYLRGGAPRTRSGVPSHMGLLLGGLIPPQAWVDSLFMHGVYLDRRFATSGAEWALAESRRLALSMVRDLADPGTGLFRHAAIDLGPLTIRLPVERMFWARGNGWAAFFLTDHQLARKARGLEPDPYIAAALGWLVEAVLCSQDGESGLFRTDLSAAAGPLAHISGPNPIETCGSALLLCALRRAAAGGLLGPLEDRAREAVRRGLGGLRSRVRFERGAALVTGTSIGTHPGFRAYYRAVPLEENAAHGVGAVLLALAAD